MPQQQFVIDIPPKIYNKPEIVADAENLAREIYFTELLAKDTMSDAEMAEYKQFIEQFVTEDDEPVDNTLSAKQQRLLVHSLYASWQPIDKNGERQQFFAEANIGLYARLNPKINAIVPDVLVSLDVKNPSSMEKRHRSYMVWEFGKPPDIVIEIVSNEIGGEINGKFDKYARIGIDYYVVFDPEEFLFGDILTVYQRDVENNYRRRDDFTLPGTGLNLTLWRGDFEDFDDTQWIRWTDADGNLILTADERAKLETERADKLAAKLRELGIDPNDV